MASKSLPTRSEISEVEKWKVEDIFPNNESWEATFSELKASLPKLESYKGRLSQSAGTLLEYLNTSEEFRKKLELVYAFSHLKKDEDTTVSSAQSRQGKAHALYVEFSQAVSFFTPEVLAIPTDVLAGFQSSEPGLGLYAHVLDDINRRRPHTLDVEKEQLLAMVGDIAHGPESIFDMLNDADIKFGTIKDEEGEDVELTKGRYMQFLECKDRRVRKDAFDTLYDAYGKQKNTLAAIYNASVKKDVFYAKARKYDSALVEAVFDDNIDRKVYDSLVESVRKNLDKLHRYVALRKKALGLDEIHFYDLYVPIVKDVEIKKTFSEAKSLCVEGLKPLGQDYLEVLNKAFESRWIDVYETQGKRGGAYSFGVYGVHPFVLLNYQGRLDDVFTLAHEMGHALHSYYTQKTQPYVYADYTIFLAEVASTCNEALLMHHLLETTKDVEQRKYLINHYLETFRGTLYRQTMFAEFERLTHALVESGETLTQELLCDEYKKLVSAYFGEGVVVDEEIALEWARIPHFYRAFYVYQYATGISAATALALAILREGQPAVDRYINFLSSGSKDYSLNLLAQAGVDMRTPEPVDKALAVFGDLVAEMETLI